MRLSIPYKALAISWNLPRWELEAHTGQDDGDDEGHVGMADEPDHQPIVGNWAGRSSVPGVRWMNRRRPYPDEALPRRPYRHAPRVPGPLVLPGRGVGAAGSILLGRRRRQCDRPGPVGDDADPVALAVAGEVALDIEARS